MATVNVTDGGGHSLDHAARVELFEILSSAGECFHLAEIQTYLSSLNWSARNAQGIADVAAKLFRGHRFRVERGNWPPDILAMWRQACG